MNPLRIVLGDLAYYNEYVRVLAHLPLNVGLLATYARQRFGRDVDIVLYKKPERLLQDVRQTRPDIVGLATYMWNTALNHAVSKKIRALYGSETLIVCGGPSVDDDGDEQKLFWGRHPQVDALICYEGELGFANLIGRRLAYSQQDLWAEAIDGVVFRRDPNAPDSELVTGSFVGLKTDLADMDSPYLTGFMDKFIAEEDCCYRPVLQTSRLCPYTCAFCVSGKSHGKLRSFPIERVKAEIDFIVARYKHRPDIIFYIIDENFGILKRDVEIAQYIRKVADDNNYPRKIFFYMDKKFQQPARDVVDTLGDINFHGLPLALQSENKEALSVSKRKNLTDTQIEDAISWASERNLPTTTELIFGLPGETRSSFEQLLEVSVRRGFDMVQCYNLSLIDGIEMSRVPYRRRHELQSRFRQLSGYLGEVDGEFLAEVDEIVVGTRHLDFEDFIHMRGLNFLFYTVYTLNCYKWFFQFIRQLGVAVVDFIGAFLNPDPSQTWPAPYLKFLSDFDTCIRAELHPSEQDAIAAIERSYRNNGNQMAAPTRLNVVFGARLVYQERHWIGDVLKRHLRQLVELEEKAEELVDAFLTLSDREWVRVPRGSTPDPMTFDRDILAWQKAKFRPPLLETDAARHTVSFRLEDRVASRFAEFEREYQRDFQENRNARACYFLMGYVSPRSKLRYDLVTNG